MSKQIYIDSNGNEVQVSGTVNTADMMPMSGNDSTKVSEAIGDLSELTTSVTSSLVGAVNEVVSNKSNLLAIEDFTSSFSVSANTDVAVNFDITKSGYTPLGVVFYTLANKDCVPHAIFLTNSTTATFHVTNVSATAKTNISARATVLFVKN